MISIFKYVTKYFAYKNYKDNLIILHKTIPEFLDLVMVYIIKMKTI